jgi:hypothetical protein
LPVVSRAALRALAVTFLALGLPGAAGAAEGAGTMEVKPTHVTAGSTDNTLTFTYTANTGAFVGLMRVDVAANWTLPQNRNPAAPGYVSLQNVSCAGTTRILNVGGRRLTILTSCGRNRQFTLTYAHATAPPFASDGFTFVTQTRPVAKKGQNRKRLRFRPLAEKKQPTVIVDGGPIDQLTANATSVATAGTAFTLTVRTVDRFGNTASGYTGTVSFASTDPRATLPGAYTFVPTDAGAHIFSGVVLRTPGVQRISVVDNSGRATATGAISVYPSAGAPA